MTLVEIEVGESRKASHWLTARNVGAFKPTYRDKTKYRFGDGTLSIMVLFIQGEYESVDYARWIAAEFRKEHFTSMLCKWWAEDWQEATAETSRRKVELNVK